MQRKHDQFLTFFLENTRSAMALSVRLNLFKSLEDVAKQRGEVSESPLSLDPLNL